MAIDTIKSTAVLDGSITSDDLSYPLTGFSSTGIDDNADATAITINSSESVLVGKSVDTLATSGTALFANGQIDSSVDGNYVAKFNRKSSHGTIVELRKDTTNIVGSIGVNNSDNFTVQGNSGHSGIEFGTNAIFPHKNSTNVDNTIDLGEGSLRWKDAYLSGGIYLGGTGSANKLDDYEEGTFTPSLITGTVNGKFGHYTKIGNIVIARIEMGDFSNTSANSNIEVNNLPFTSSSSSSTGSTGSVFCRYCTRIPNATYVGNSDTRMVMWQSSSGSYVTVKHADLNSGSAYFYIQVIYEAA